MLKTLEELFGKHPELTTRMKELIKRIWNSWNTKFESDGIDDIITLENEFFNLYLIEYPNTHYESGQEILY